MSLAQGFNTFMKGSIAADNLREGRRARDMQEQQVNLSEEEAGYKRDQMDMTRAMALAEQLGVAADGGRKIDIPMFTEMLVTGRDNKKFNPLAEELASIVANTDYTARKNKDFEFGGLSIGPEGTLTLRGSYAGQEGEKYATTSGGPGSEEEVAFAPPEQVANFVNDQYMQMFSKRANAGLYMQITKKMELAGTFDQAGKNRALVEKAIGDVREEIDLVLSKSNDPAYGKAARNLKAALSGPKLTLDQKLEIVRDFGSQLDLPVSDIIGPQVEEAINNTGTETTGTDTADTTATAEVKVKGGEATTDNSAKLAELEARMAKVPPGRAGLARKKELQNRIDQLKSEDPTAEIARLEAEIASIPSGEGRGGELKRKALQEQVDRLKGASPASPESAGAESQVDPVVAGLVAKIEQGAQAPGEPIARATAEELTALKKVLELDGVKSFADLNKTNRTNQFAILSTLSSASYVDADQRKVYQQALTNLTETGTLSFDSKTLAGAQVDQQKANTSAQSANTSQDNAKRLNDSFRYEVSSKLNTFVENQVNPIRDLFVDEEGNPTTPSKEAYYAVATGTGGSLSTMFRRLMGAKTRKDGTARSGESRSIAQQEYNGLKAALLAQVSFGLQFISRDGDLEWSLATDSDAPLTGSDSSLSRIERDGAATAKGGPSGIKITKPGSSQQDGDAFTAEQVMKFFGNDDLASLFFNSLDEAKSRGR